MATNDEPQSAPKRFQCAQCPKSFAGKPMLKEHILLKHTEDKLKPSYPCKKCLKSFATKRFLHNHIGHVHGPHPFKCQFCIKTFHHPSGVRRHQLWVHSKQNIKETEGHKCFLCSKILFSEGDLRRHLLQAHKRKIEGASYFKCELCAFEFAKRSDLENHVVEKHVVDKAFECLVCSKTFIDQDTLDKHITNHDNKIKYFCDMCSNGFKHKKSLVRHLRVGHLKLFYCDKCSRSFESKSKFDQHSDSSKTSISSELKCQMCNNKSFDSQCSLDAHTNNHLKEMSSENQDEIKNLANSTKIVNLPTMPILPDAEKLNLKFQCELCSKVFDRQSYLQAHRNLVHPNADWTCSFAGCTKTFKRNSNLKLHKLTHVDNTGRKPFVCHICQKLFHTPDNLQQHVRRHTQDKKHKCVSCPKSFAKADNLRVHIANHHGGPKPFKCPVLNCGKSSANSSFLNRHLATHQTERIKCELCTEYKTFKCLRSLQDHMQRVHSDDYLSQNHNRTKNSKASEAAVFICSSKECSFETVSEKEVAVHYSEQHGLPKVVVSPSRIGSKMKNNNVVNSSSLFSGGNASSEIKDAGYRIIQIRYKCKFCKRLFKLCSSLWRHRRTHLQHKSRFSLHIEPGKYKLEEIPKD